jgi:hypothetical protein
MAKEQLSNVYPTEEEITERVYELFLDHLSTSTPNDYWTIAETELLERAASRAIRTGARPKRRPRR